MNQQLGAFLGIGKLFLNQHQTVVWFLPVRKKRIVQLKSRDKILGCFGNNKVRDGEGLEGVKPYGNNLVFHYWKIKSKAKMRSLLKSMSSKLLLLTYKSYVSKVLKLVFLTWRLITILMEVFFLKKWLLWILDMNIHFIHTHIHDVTLIDIDELTNYINIMGVVYRQI